MDKAFYRKRIIDFRAKIAREKEAKKRDNESYARSIKNASSASMKASFRKSKIDKAAYHDREIAYYKRQIESAQASMKSCSR